MHRRKPSASYEVSTPSKGGAYTSAESSNHARHADKMNAFLDLRVDLHDRATKSSAAKSILGVSKAPLLASKSGKATPTGGATYQSTLALTMPSATPNGLKRCQSASTIRKKLQHAMDQSVQTYQNQAAALRSLSATAIAKPTPKSLLLNQRGSSSSVSLLEAAEPASGMKDTSVGNQHSSKPRYATMFAEPSVVSSSTKRPSSAAGGMFRSNTIELEVQLAERLNEIERSKLCEKAESRFRASQRAFDQVIQQDEAFSRILASIRDEYDAYISFLTHNQRTAAASGCRCSHTTQQADNQRREAGFDVALVRQENSILKKSCSSMQREIEVLQASVLTAAAQRGISKSHAGKTASQPEDDSGSDNDEELSGVLLLPLYEAVEQEPERPPIIPQLDFSSLPPYNEEEEEEFDEAEEQY